MSPFKQPDFAERQAAAAKAKQAALEQFRAKAVAGQPEAAPIKPEPRPQKKSEKKPAKEARHAAPKSPKRK
jgi:hypothetical protein